MIIIGHKNPDTDSIVSSIAYAKLCNFLGKTAEAGRLGEINPETQFVLDKFGLDAPIIVNGMNGNTFALVDHNSFEETLSGIDETKIVEVVDHHKITLKTSNPIFIHIEPLGSTCSVIYKIMKQNNFPIDSNLAGAMLSAILSDTVIFKSPTSTQEDKLIAEELAKIAKIHDIVSFGVEIKKKKADFSKTPASEIVATDAKDFDFCKKKAIIAQVEVFDWALKERKKELLEAMKQKKGNMDIYALMITNIMTEETYLLFEGDEQSIKNAFPNGKFEESAVLLEKTMSRKKQIIPPLQKVCEI